MPSRSIRRTARPVYTRWNLPKCRATLSGCARGAPYPETVLNLFWKSRNLPTTPEPALAEQQARVRLLNEELSQLRGAAVERTRTTDTKASFLVVAAGFLAGVAGSELVDSDAVHRAGAALAHSCDCRRVGNGPVAACAERSSARHVVDTYVNANMSPETLEDHLLEIRTKEVEKRNAQNESKAGLTKWGFGFILLIAAMASSLAVVVVTAILGA